MVSLCLHQLFLAIKFSHPPLGGVEELALRADMVLLTQI